MKFVVLPYYGGISERLQRVFNGYGVKVCFKPHQTLRQRLVRPKDKLDKLHKCGVVYNIKCKDCEAEYIGETARRLGTRLKEHRKSVTEVDLKSAVSEHSRDAQHHIDWDATRIIDQENNLLRRKIREAIHIRREHPSMNRDQGYQLASVYGAVIKPRSDS